MKHRIFITEFPTDTRLQLSDVVVWLANVIDHYKATIHRLSYTFVSPEHLLTINQNHLDHHDYTDIITFSFGTDQPIDADIYLCRERWKENAKLNNQSIEDELLRLLSHGFLHCIGYNDKSPAERTQMRVEENRCITMFHVKHHPYV